MSLSPLDAPAIDLSAFDEAYANAGRSTSDPNLDVPDGQYRVMVEDVHVAETRTGKPMIHWSLRVVGPAEADKRLVCPRVITDRTLSWIKEDFEKLGLRLNRLSECQDQLPQLAGREVMIDKRSDSKGSTIYFRWPDRSLPVPDDDDLPF
ncbi:MAG: hypothetical protein MUC42_15065 [Bryobacter sp.]|nr:hypothetical protein [Bryobacter sp.]